MYIIVTMNKISFHFVVATTATSLMNFSPNTWTLLIAWTRQWIPSRKKVFKLWTGLSWSIIKANEVCTLRGNINHFPTVLWEDWKGKEKRFLLGTWVIYNKGNIFVKTGEPGKIIERKERKNFTGSWTLKNSEIDNLRTHFSFQFLCYEPLAFVLDSLS